MAVAFDKSVIGNSGSSSVQTLATATLTAAGANELIVASLHLPISTVNFSSVSVSGGGLTWSAVTSGSFNSGAPASTFIFSAVTGASFSAAITFTWTGSSKAIVIASAYSGTATSITNGVTSNFTSTINASESITTHVNNSLVIGVLTANTNTTVNPETGSTTNSTGVNTGNPGSTQATGWQWRKNSVTTPTGSVTMGGNGSLASSRSGVIDVLEIPPPSSSNPLPSVSDSTATTDTPTIEIISNINVTDTTTTTDMPQIAETDTIIVSDSSAITATVQIAEADTILVTETSAVTDTITVEVLSFVNVTNSSAVVDSFTTYYSLALSLGATVSGNGREVVRISGGTLYAIVNNAGTVQIYKSSSGISWVNQDASHSPASKVNVPICLCVDSTDTLHIFYVASGSANNITHATYNTSTDLFGTPETAITGTSSNTVGAIDSAVDSNDIPHVVAGRSTIASNQWVYSNKVGGVWNTAISTTIMNGVSFLSIAIDNNNLPQIAALENLTAVSAYIGNLNNATSFTRTALDTSFINGNVGIALDSNNNSWVSYLDASNIVTLIEHKSGDPWGTWQATVTDSKAGEGTSIATNSTYIYVFYEQNAGGTIAYDRYDGVSAWIGETLINGSGGTIYHRPIVKWSKYNNNEGSSQIDYLFDDGNTVYWDDLLLPTTNPSFSVTDSTAISDTPTILIPILVPSVSDSTGVTDTPIVEIICLINVTDSSAVTDTTTEAVISVISVTDSTAVSDVRTVEEVNLILVSDSTVVSDTPIVEIINLISVTDQTPISEAWQIGYPIKFDNAASFSSILTSISGSFTTAGSNRALVAFVYSASGLFDISNPTYGGVVMEDVAEIALPSGYPGFVAAYYLPNPAIGANTFAVSRTGTGTVFAASVMSYDQVSPDSIIDKFDVESGLLVSSITTTITSGVNGEWDFMGVVSGLNSTVSAGSGATARTQSSPLWAFDSNGSIGVANTSYSMTATSSSSVDGLAAVAFTLEPFIGFTSKPVILAGDDIFVLEQPIVQIITAVSVSDSSAVSDTPTIEVISLPSVSDSSAVSDTPTINLRSFVSVTDSTAVSDTPIIEVFSFVNVTDSSAVSATPIVEIIYLVSVTDSSAVSDVPTIEIVSLVSATDSSAVTATPIIEIVYLPSITDSTAVSDTPILEIISFINITESTAVSEIVAVSIVGASPTFNVSDSTAVSESITIELFSFPLVTDSSAVTGIPTIEMFSFINVSDSSAVTDTPAVAEADTISVSDSTAMSEIITVEMFSFVNVSDSTAVADSPTLEIVSFISITNSSVVTDTVVTRMFSFVNVTDSTAVTESVAFTVGIALVVSDSTIVTDTVTVQAGNAPLNPTDTAQVTDTSTIEIVSFISITDSTAVSDTPQFNIKLDVQDFVTVADSVAILLPYLLVIVSDTITVTDLVSVFKPVIDVLVSDATHVTESVSLRVARPFNRRNRILQLGWQLTSYVVQTKWRKDGYILNRKKQ